MSSSLFKTNKDNYQNHYFNSFINYFQNSFQNSSNISSKVAIIKSTDINYLQEIIKDFYDTYNINNQKAQIRPDKNIWNYKGLIIEENFYFHKHYIFKISTELYNQIISNKEFISKIINKNMIYNRACFKDTIYGQSTKLMALESYLNANNYQKYNHISAYNNIINIRALLKKELV